MNQGKSINLFDSKASFSPTLLLIEKYLRASRILLLGFVCIVGIMSVIVYSVVRIRTNQLEAEKIRLTAEVQQQSVKEGMLLALRARIASLKKILDVQFSVAPYIDTTLLIAQPPRLLSFSIGEKNTVQISVELPTVADAVLIMETILRMVNENKIRNPNLTSLVLDKSGTVTLGITYFVLLKPAL